MRKLLAAIPACVTGLPAFAQSVAGNGDTLTGSDPLGAGGLLQITLSLIAVLVTVFAVGWFLRRLQGMSGGANGALKVLGVLPLGARERIVLVQAGDTQLLVGLAPGRVQALHVLDEPVTDLEEVSAGKPPAALFKALMGSGKVK